MPQAQMAGMAAAADGSGGMQGHMQGHMAHMIPGHPPGPPMMQPGVSGGMIMVTPPRDGGHPGQMGGPGMTAVAMMAPPGGVMPPHPPPHPMGPGQAHRVGGPVPVHAGPPPAAAGDGRQGGGAEDGGGGGGYQRGGQGQQHGRDHGGGHRGMYRCVCVCFRGCDVWEEGEEGGAFCRGRCVEDLTYGLSTALRQLRTCHWRGLSLQLQVRSIAWLLLCLIGFPRIPD